jgi:hypothetical protein
MTSWGLYSFPTAMIAARLREPRRALSFKRSYSHFRYLKSPPTSEVK